MSTKGANLIVDDPRAELELLRQANGQFQCELAERKQAELEIQRQAAFPCFNPNPVLELSAAGEISYLNEAAREMARALGLENPAQMLPPNTATMVRECLATGRPKLRVETQIDPHPGHASGVRPSPGAATSASGGGSELQHPGRGGGCCARGRAYFGPVAFIGTPKLRPADRPARDFVVLLPYQAQQYGALLCGRHHRAQAGGRGGARVTADHRGDS